MNRKGVSGVVREEGIVMGSQNHSATHVTNTKMQ